MAYRILSENKIIPAGETVYTQPISMVRGISAFIAFIIVRQRVPIITPTNTVTIRLEAVRSAGLLNIASETVTAEEEDLTKWDPPVVTDAALDAIVPAPGKQKEITFLRHVPTSYGVFRFAATNDAAGTNAFEVSYYISP